ncbi:MAG TPA: hypothetical protein VFZ24_09020 [Longimicrobiales bacterium]
MPITSTDVAPVADAPADGSAPRSRRSSTPEWLLRVSVESLLIVMSILLALAVDEWREGRNYQELAQHSLEIFGREIEQNLAMLSEIVPYHVGLRDVVTDMAAHPDRVVDVHSILEGLEPTVLQNTAWETALATGSFRYIDVATVSKLSLMYGLQQRYQATSGRPELYVTSATTPEQKLEQMQHALMYLNDLVRAEQRLLGVYLLALEEVPDLAALRSDSAAPAASAQ